MLILIVGLDECVLEDMAWSYMGQLEVQGLVFWPCKNSSSKEMCSQEFMSNELVFIETTRNFSHVATKILDNNKNLCVPGHAIYHKSQFSWVCKLIDLISFFLVIFCVSSDFDHRSWPIALCYKREKNFWSNLSDFYFQE